MNSLRVVFFVFICTGCPKDFPLVAEVTLNEADVIGAKVDALESEIATVVKTVDEQLWQHWTSGVPLDFNTVTQRHASLFSKQSLMTLRRAREIRPLDVKRLENLERWLAGELLARAVASESEALANLEASDTIVLEGKDYPWSDLSKLLANERSAIKRRALWAASHETARHLEAAIVRRDEKIKETLAALELPSALDFAADIRKLDLEALAKVANDELARTDAEWKATLEALSEDTVKLPVNTLTRADLPRLMRVAATVDAQFPKAKIATRAVQTLGTLGVYGKPGLTLDLAVTAKKIPLPLTVAPSLQDVRVSIKPVGGMKDQQAVLAELGTALSLHRTQSSSFALERLKNPSEALRTSELFGSLVEETSWLEANEVSQPAQVIAAAKAQRLYALRHAAGVVLAKLETQGLSDEAESQAKFVTITARALGLNVGPEEGVRWRLETDDFLRSATQLEAMRGAVKLRATLGEGWWLKPLTNFVTDVSSR